ncbi:MAG: HNH endonuclease [Parachlamydiaceae bacterium]|nr:HNH endonuclease [Parachlamydiaceae bacterium]
MFDDNFLHETLQQAFNDEEYYYIPKGIVRFDYENVHGWFVRVTRDRAQFQKLFSDNIYKSIQDAFREAIIYRHEILKNFPVTLKHIHKRSLPLEPEKRISHHVDPGKNQPYIYWQAKWYNKNHIIERENYSVLKFGEEGAKISALKAATERHYKKPKLSSIPDPYLRNDIRQISRADVEVLSKINGPRSRDNHSNKNTVIKSYPFAFEGERKLAVHKTIERDKKLRNQKIQEFLSSNDKIFCELCHFNFLDNYPFLTSDIIEVHHIIPLGTLTESKIYHTKDLMLLCSNCHLALHQGDAEDNLLIAMEYFENKNNK